MQAKLNPTHFEEIEPHPDDDKYVVQAIIETPRDQRHKYAFDPKTGAFRQTMVLPDGLEWPYDYGFIPQTLADDGDPLDILFLADEPTFTGCLVKARILGIVRLCKNGVENDRVLTCPLLQDGVSQSSDSFHEIDDVPKATLDNICRYLVEYSEAEGNHIEFRGTKSRKHALHAIERAHKAFKKQS